ncbi:cytochrome d ubiquinol oxidase subunit II [Paenibacillus sp. IB182496]|uniref:Cytochrome d ubiquinol oxidase subunit II n=1 Tax=Paenibacillus sabuli TaxID=2772509 RepID=A0A927BTS2_9BACL|nr:cytochrome d ubiquinol oxidase subunit II [Paenibacillus sabuli]MBD2845379.1 cytochrome d ubiquinol oxidase subunit II [Paenibacillus sabuli]
MSLNELWFVLIAVLFTGFFFLEGFDFGVGMATRLLAKSDTDRRIMLNTIGPFWDANEVWLITAAGAMLAAFPHWYATMFSGYYLLFALVLLALIGRGVAFEFRSKLEAPRWRRIWDGAILIGSTAPPLLLGMALAGAAAGVPIGADMEMAAGWSDIVNVYTVLGGLTLTGLCLLHGLHFLALRTTGELRERSRRMALRWMPWQGALLAAFAVATWLSTDLFERRGLWLGLVLALGAAAYALAAYWNRGGREGLAFAMSGATIALGCVALFAGLFPRVMVSSLDAAYDLTIYNAASGSYTLTAMTIVAACLLPFVLGYQAWSYVVFHKRLRPGDHLEY